MIKVVKIGGNVLDDDAALKQFCRDFAALQGPKVLVHGGGALASRMQEKLGQKPISSWSVCYRVMAATPSAFQAAMAT